MGEGLKSAFQNPEFQNEDEGLIIESGKRDEPFTEYRLSRKIGGETLRRIYTESYGRRNIGWILLASGAIYVTAKGLDRFRKKFPEEVED